MDGTKPKTYRVTELAGTPESRAEEEIRILRRVFGEDVDLNASMLEALIRSGIEPSWEVAEDGTIRQVK